VETDTRQCEFCKDWDEKYLEEFLTPETVCGACNGTKELGIDECFCYARLPSECGCNALWGDWTYLEEDY
jgi:hypothetical protein